ncbi:erythromycin esterase family protein [Hymenobacter sp. B1770]|uniref:erythromycin esterase family protein n=1 Tax=Hymenobacter sp. B1770 TaxID=1718788 RepID=UPI003CF84059
MRQIARALLLVALCYGCEQKPSANQANAPEAPDAMPMLAVGGPPQGPKPVHLEIPSHPLRSEADLDPLVQAIGNARVVLLGEASHGTHEYYTWRAALSKRLIEEKGFNFIAVEGEWADSYRVNKFIKGPQQDSAAAVQLLKHYNRWPTWMWGNYEVASLVTWLNGHNQKQAAANKAGFFGLDVYCLWEALADLTPHLQRTDAAALQAAQRAQRCFQPYSPSAEEYALAVARADADCRATTSRLWQAVVQATGKEVPREESQFVAQQHALVALNGERYYRASATGSAESWNIRDRHMAETLDRLLTLHGPASKAIVWEHNTHVGDARYTDMANSGEVNVGQLVRQKYGRENAFILGFGSYQGSVIAADAWGAPHKVMPVPEAQSNSWEDILHRSNPGNKLVLMKDLRDNKYLKRRIGHRAIGVVYNPRVERFGNYVPSVVPQRYDAFMFIDKTRALQPLNTPVKGNEPPDLYPSGL